MSNMILTKILVTLKSGSKAPTKNTIKAIQYTIKDCIDIVMGCTKCGTKLIFVCKTTAAIL